MATLRRAVGGTAAGVPTPLPSYRSAIAMPGPRPHASLPTRPIRPAIVRLRHALHPRAVEEAVERVRREYLEWPTLRLTVPQVRRLFGLSDNQCAAVLSSLLGTGFLAPTGNGQFCLVDPEGQRASCRIARARDES